MSPDIMEFKIDTKESYSIISPTATHIDASMAGAIETHCQSLADNGSNNYLIDLLACQGGDEQGFEALARLHEKCYSEGRSLVFTNINNGLFKQMREAQMDGALNIAPTEIEGIDIIHMEILERDLLGEEGLA